MLWVYYTIPFGLSLMWHFFGIIFNLLNYFVWLRITDEGSVPEMRMWSINKKWSDLKWFIHLSRSLCLNYYPQYTHANVFPNCTTLPILTLLPNFGGFHGTLQRVQIANRGRLILRTPDPVPFGTCICSNADAIFSRNCHIYGAFEFPTSIVTSMLIVSSPYPHFVSIENPPCIKTLFMQSMSYIHIYTYLLYADCWYTGKYTWAPQTVHNTPVINILKG